MQKPQASLRSWDETFRALAEPSEPAGPSAQHHGPRPLEKTRRPGLCPQPAYLLLADGSRGRVDKYPGQRELEQYSTSEHSLIGNSGRSAREELLLQSRGRVRERWEGAHRLPPNAVFLVSREPERIASPWLDSDRDMPREAPMLPKARDGSWVTVKVRRSVATLQPDLMTTELAEIDQQFGIELHATVLSNVQLDHPAINAFRIKLLVPGGVQGIGEIHAASVAADLYHLGSSVQWLSRFSGMGSTTHNSADVHRADQLGIEGIRDIVLAHLSRSP